MNRILQCLVLVSCAAPADAEVEKAVHLASLRWQRAVGVNVDVPTGWVQRTVPPIRCDGTEVPIDVYDEQLEQAALHAVGHFLARSGAHHDGPGTMNPDWFGDRITTEDLDLLCDTMTCSNYRPEKP